MKTKLGVVIGLLACHAGVEGVSADGTATWLWDVTTENGDAIVEPGETATITLSVDMSPGVNFPDGPVLGLATGVFDTLGGVNADKGSITGWELLYPFNELIGKGDYTTTDGISLFGTAVGQHPESDVFSPADPIGIISFMWTSDTPGSYVASYATLTEQITVWEGSFPGNDNFDPFPWSVVEAEIAFQVVPGVATGSATIAGLGIYAQRRRQAPSSRPRSRAARPASTTASMTSLSSNMPIAAAVVPPLLVTAARSAPGSSSLASRSAPAPAIVARTMRAAVDSSKPMATPARVMASAR